jgi:hypothetical protein
MCSHRIPYEARCPFCFRAAMNAEKLRRWQDAWQSHAARPTVVLIDGKARRTVWSLSPDIHHWHVPVQRDQDEREALALPLRYRREY